MPNRRTIDNGYIKLYRKFFDSELWQEKRKYSKAEAWIDLIEMARWGEKPETLLDKRGSYILDFGDIYISARFLGIRWQWSKNKVIHFLEYLEKRESILFKKRDSHRTIINLVNLKVYLGWENCKKDRERTGKGQGKDRERTKKKPLEPLEPEKPKDMYVDFPDLNIEAWYKWLAYKKQIKKNYKTENGEINKITELLKLSNSNQDLQMKIVDQSIDEEYQGLFPLKKDNNTEGGKLKWND